MSATDGDAGERESPTDDAVERAVSGSTVRIALGFALATTVAALGLVGAGLTGSVALLALAGLAVAEAVASIPGIAVRVRSAASIAITVVVVVFVAPLALASWTAPPIPIPALFVVGVGLLALGATIGRRLVADPHVHRSAFMTVLGGADIAASLAVVGSAIAALVMASSHADAVGAGLVLVAVVVRGLLAVGDLVRGGASSSERPDNLARARELAARFASAPEVVVVRSVRVHGGRRNPRTFTAHLIVAPGVADEVVSEDLVIALTEGLESDYDLAASALDLEPADETSHGDRATDPSDSTQSSPSA